MIGQLKRHARSELLILQVSTLNNTTFFFLYPFHSQPFTFSGFQGVLSYCFKLWTSATSIGLSLTGNPLAFVKIPQLARKWASYLFHRRDVVFPINRECNFIHIVHCLPLCFRTQRTGIRLSSPPTWSPLTGCDVHTGVWACTRRASECIVMCDPDVPGCTWQTHKWSFHRGKSTAFNCFSISNVTSLPL